MLTVINVAVYVYIHTMQYNWTTGGVAVQKYAAGTFDITN
jgi:hypothetical protein